MKAFELAPRMRVLVTDELGLALMSTLLLTWMLASWRFAWGRGGKRDGLALLVAVFFTHFWSPTLHNQHLGLIGWIAAILWMFPSMEDRRLLLRTLTTTLYAFATLSKLTPDFLSGAVLSAHLPTRPVGRLLGLDALLGRPLVALSVLTIVVEGWLAAGLWFERTRHCTVFLSIGFHSLVLVLMAENTMSFLRLFIFNGLALLLYVAFFPRTWYGPWRR